jgi:hypothetical protein
VWPSPLVSAAPVFAQLPKNLPPAVPPWPDGAPGSERRAAEPEHVDGSNVCNVHNPTLTPYVPDAAKSTGTAVIICMRWPTRAAPFASSAVESPNGTSTPTALAASVFSGLRATIANRFGSDTNQIRHDRASPPIGLLAEAV